MIMILIHKRESPMKLCICRDVSDKEFKTHLAEQALPVTCAEKALNQCCGSPTNCGQCLEMADEIVFSHNLRVETIRSLQTALPSKARETA
jgi:bacterioferritin-associated ferredoxin